MVAKEKEDPPKSLLEIMVEAKVLTRSQMVRLIQEAGETTKKFQIPGYQVISKIGKGSMGVVYKAKQVSVDRVVAIKILLDTLAQNKEFIKRFEREAKIAARLSHNNIVNAIDAGEVDGHYYFVMEYVEGPTIKDHLDKNKTFDEKEALQIVLAVAEALKHAHSTRPDPSRHQAGERHPDQGRRRQARRPGAGADHRRREMGALRGRHGHRHALLHQPRAGPGPDEHRHPGRHLQPRRHALPHGDRPGPLRRRDPQRRDAQARRPNVAFVPPDHLNTNLSGGLGMVVETMMAKNREHRYHSPDDLILDLKCLMRDESPMIAGQKPETLEALAEGESDGMYYQPAASEGQMIEMASYVNNRNHIIATMAMILAVSVITNVILLVVK